MSVTNSNKKAIELTAIQLGQLLALVTLAHGDIVVGMVNSIMIGEDPTESIDAIEGCNSLLEALSA